MRDIQAMTNQEAMAIIDMRINTVDGIHAIYSKRKWPNEHDGKLITEAYEKERLALTMAKQALMEKKTSNPYAGGSDIGPDHSRESMSFLLGGSP